MWISYFSVVIFSVLLLKNAEGKKMQKIVSMKKWIK